MCDLFQSHTYIKINNDWYDVTNFVDTHPGGKSILQKYNKKDATEKFYSIKGHYNYLHTLDDFLIRDINLLNKLNKKIDIL
jgi:cytochrome b involved in lipid metabolism